MADRTLIITGCHETFWPLHRRTIDSKRLWCDKQGYDLLDVRQWDLTTLAWDRVWWVRKMLAHYGQVAWIDGDSYITNPSLCFNDILPSDFTFYIGHDWGETEDDAVSAGNFVARRGPAVNAMFAHLEYLHRRYPNHNEQWAIRECVKRKMPGIYVLQENHLSAVPMNIQEGSLRPWDEKHLLAHLTTNSMTTRFRWIDLFEGKVEA